MNKSAIEAIVDHYDEMTRRRREAGGWAPKDLSGVAAFKAATDAGPLRMTERETEAEFVKRIVCAYLNAVEKLRAGKGRSGERT